MLRRILVLSAAVMLVLALALAATVLPLMLALSPSGTAGPRPSDAALIANWQAHRAELDILVAMIRADRGLTKVDATWTEPPDATTVGVTAERLARYRALFARAGVPRGVRAYEHSVVLIAYASGLFIHGSAKNYVYAPERSRYDCSGGDDLEAAAGDARKFVDCRFLGDGWFIELTID